MSRFPPAAFITGVPSFSALGQPIADVLQLPPAVLQTLGDELGDRGARRQEFLYRTADGRGEIVLGLSTTHLVTPGGRAGFLFSFQDVTKIKRLERDSALQQRLAAHAARGGATGVCCTAASGVRGGGGSSGEEPEKSYY